MWTFMHNQLMTETYGATTAEAIDNMRALQVELDCLETEAHELNVETDGLPDAYEPLPCQDREQARQWALALHARFTELNERVWPLEEELGPETDWNAGVRELGDKCHAWYEAWKFKAAFALDMRHGDWPMQPCFGDLFKTALDRAKKGDKIARRLMKDKWGFEVNKRGVKAIHAALIVG